MTKERVMTNPEALVRMELKNKGFDLDTMKVPARVYLLADCIYDAMLEKDCGIYQYPLGGKLYVLKKNPKVGFIKAQMCSPGIATQAEDLAAGGVKEFIHVGLAGGINRELNVGDVILTEGAYNDTAVAGLYGYHDDFIDTTVSLTDEVEQQLMTNEIKIHRGKHWTTDAGYHETWEQIVGYSSKGALCVEMEGAGLFTIAKYRNCSAAAIYIISDVISEDGWHLGWENDEIDHSVNKMIQMISESEAFIR